MKLPLILTLTLALDLEVSGGERPVFLAHDESPQGWQELVSECWHAVPKSRPTFNRVLEQLRLIKVRINEDKCKADTSGDIRRRMTYAFNSSAQPSAESYDITVKAPLRSAMAMDMQLPSRTRANSWASLSGSQAAASLLSNTLSEPLLM